MPLSSIVILNFFVLPSVELLKISSVSGVKYNAVGSISPASYARLYYSPVSLWIFKTGKFSVIKIIHLPLYSSNIIIARLKKVSYLFNFFIDCDNHIIWWIVVTIFCRYTHIMDICIVWHDKRVNIILNSYSWYVV